MIVHDLFLPTALPVLALGTILLLLSITWRRSVVRSLSLSAGTLIATLFAVAHDMAAPAPGIQTLFIRDRWSDYTGVLVLLSSLCLIALSWRELARNRGQPVDEYALLLLLGTLGGMAMVFSANAMPFFLGLETMGMALLGLVAFRSRQMALSGEASMKYLVLSGTASAILLLGIGLSYVVSGNLRFGLPPFGANGGLFLPAAAAILTLIGLLFKLSAVPFHMWILDVMEGAPTPVAAFIAVVSKLAVFSALVRYFATPDLPVSLHVFLVAITALTMLGGNLLALRQTSLVRLLACSSIAHMGYLLLAFQSPGSFQSGALTVYLAAYAAGTMGAFAAIGAFSTPDGEPRVRIQEWKGLFYTRPFLAVMMSVMMLSLAGIPPCIGFFAKLGIAATGVERDRLFLLVLLVVGSIIGLYYYLNVVRVMLTPATEPSDLSEGRIFPELTALLAVLAVIVVVGGLFPAGMIRTILPISVAAVPMHETRGAAP